MYIAVLGASVLVTVLGLSALLVARIEGRSAVAEADIAEARRCAAAGIEIARYVIQSTANWRTRGSGIWMTAVTLGKGQVTVHVTDPSDDDITDSASEPIVITATGTAGRATQYLTATLSPQSSGYECLNSGVHAGGAISLTSATVLSDRTIGSNVSITATTSSVQANAEAVGLVAGATYTKTTTSGITARAMPDSTALDAWVSLAQNIPYASLSSSGGSGRTMENTVLSPTGNSYGSPHASGIYVIDCSNNQVTIQNCRIYGTLILLNPGAGSAINGSIRWDVPVANQPALLVKGNITVSTSQTLLSEATCNANFNPTGTPYMSSADADKTDTYPSSICGLIFISGNATLLGANTISGALMVGGTLSLAVNSTTGVAARLDLSYSDIYYTSPPTGFAAPTTMRLSGNGIVQVVK